MKFETKRLVSPSGLPYVSRQVTIVLGRLVIVTSFAWRTK